MMHIINGLKIEEIKETGVFCYLIVSENSKVLIDTGLSSFSKILLKRVQPYVSAGELLHVYITHADPDHIGGLASLRKHRPLNVSAHPAEEEAILAGKLSREIHPRGLEKIPYKLIGLMTKMNPEIVDHTFSPTSSILVFPGMQILHTPGHTPGHCSFFMEREGILFSGDSITYAHGRLSPSSGANNWDVNLSRSSFEIQKSLKPEWIFAGHFSLATSGKHLVWST